MFKNHKIPKIIITIIVIIVLLSGSAYIYAITHKDQINTLISNNKSWLPKQITDTVIQQTAPEYYNYVVVPQEIFEKQIENKSQDDKSNLNKALEVVKTDLESNDNPISKVPGTIKYVITDSNTDKPIITVLFDISGGDAKGVLIFVYELLKKDSSYIISSKFETGTQDYSTDELIEIAKKYNLRYQTPDEQKIETESIKLQKAAQGSSQNSSKSVDKYGGVPAAKKDRILKVFSDLISDKQIKIGFNPNLIESDILKNDKGDYLILSRFNEVIYRFEDTKVEFISFYYDIDPDENATTAKLIKIVAINKDRTEEILLQ